MRLLVLSALTLAAVGCRFSPPPEPESLQRALALDPVLSAAQKAGPLAYRIGVAFPRIRFDPRERYTDNAAKHADVPDPATFRASTVEALRLAKLFARITPRGRTAEDQPKTAALAWAGKDDMILELELRDYHQAYLGHSSYMSWFLVYAFWIWPAFWMPVDYYGTGLTVHVRLRSVQAGVQPLLDKTYVVRPEDVRQELTPSDREHAGFLDWGALYNVEASLEDSNWRAIERCTGPHAWRAFQLRLLRDLAGAVAAPLRADSPQREPVLRRIRKRFAVAVGVTRYADPALGAAAHAAKDAEAVAALWGTKPGGGLVEGRDLTRLVDAQATRAGVLDALRAVAERAAPSDEVIVYLAGLGTVAPVSTGAAVAPVGSAQPVFLLHDTQAGRPAATGLPLSELGRALDAIPAERVILLIDASFSGRGGRTWGRPQALSADALPQALRVGPRRTALFASQPTQAAEVLPGGKAGLFSHVLRQALAGAADEDQDGRVTVRELAAHVGRVVRERAGLEGFRQAPLSLGNLDLPAGWPR